MGAGGDRVILPPHMDPLLEQTSIIVKDKRYVSLVRTFQDALLSTQGIVEVEQYCDALFSELDLLNGTSGSFFLFDGAWNQLYPYDGSPADPALFRRLADQAARAPDRDRRPPGEARAADLCDRHLEGHGLDPPDRRAYRRPDGERPSVRGADRAPGPDRHHLLPGGLLLHRPPRDGARSRRCTPRSRRWTWETSTRSAPGPTRPTLGRSTSCAWPSGTCG